MKCVIVTLIWLLPSLLLGETAGGNESDSPLYSPVGKRDPFKPPSTRSEGRDPAAIKAIERFSLEQFRLVAILRGDGRARAMFVDPEGSSFIIPEGGAIGRERAVISQILEFTVLITEETTNYRGDTELYERVISLPKK